MAHFAEMKDNNVEQVIVIANENCGNLPFPESEPVGQAFIAELGLPGQWLQTSYNGTFRNVFAGIGFKFDATIGEYGAFVPPTLEA